VFHDGLEAVVEGGDVFLFVMEWDNDRIFRHSANDTPAGLRDALPG
jgi:hypothetical protein